MNKKDVEKILDALFQMQEFDVQIAELEVSKVYKPKLLFFSRANSIRQMHKNYR